MKKFLVVLLSLGLIVAFSTAASAVDVKFNGSYYVAGAYDDNPQLLDTGRFSRAAFYTQTRVQMVFQVAEGLSLTTRFDALEKQVGNTDWRSITAPAEDKSGSRPGAPVQTSGHNGQENLEMEYGYVTFKTAIGSFQIGYQNADNWGTIFSNLTGTRPMFVYTLTTGPVTSHFIYEKVFEADSSDVPGFRGKVDADWDNYYVDGIFKFNGGEAGIQGKYWGNSSTRPTINAAMKQYQLAPYFKTTFGPVYLEGELNYLFGKITKYDSGATPDLDISSWNAYLMAKMTMGPAYFGGQVGWVQGDGDNATKMTRGYNAGWDWSPTLVLQNSSLGTWLPGGTDTSNLQKNDPKGYLLVNAFGGVNPMPQLNVEGSVSLIRFDTKKQWDAARTVQSEWVSKSIGTEVDVKATYKIYDNLSYMVGAGYIFTGDAYKGTDDSAKVGNNFVLLNKLTLSF